MRARGRCRAFTRAAALSWLMLAARPASAQNDVIAAECGSRPRFDQELRERLGPDVPVESVHVAIARHGERFRLSVRIGAEQRELFDQSCSELMRAAVVVAVAMLMQDRSPPRAEPQPIAPPPQQPPPMRPHLLLGAGLGVGLGTLPRPSPLLELEGQALWQAWGVALGARYLLPIKRLDELERGATLQAVGGLASLVFRPSSTWQARLGFGAQLLHGEGHGSAQTQSASVWAAGPVLGLRFAALATDGWWLGLGGDGQLNLLRGRFQIRNYNQADDREVHGVPWLTGAALVRFGLVL